MNKNSNTLPILGGDQMDQQFFNNNPENDEQISGGIPENQENTIAEETVEEVVKEEKVMVEEVDDWEENPYIGESLNDEEQLTFNKKYVEYCSFL